MTSCTVYWSTNYVFLSVPLFCTFSFSLQCNEYGIFRQRTVHQYSVHSVAIQHSLDFLWKCYNLWWLPPGYVSFAHFLLYLELPLKNGYCDKHHVSCVPHLLPSKDLIFAVRGLSHKVVDFCYNTRLCVMNSMKFVWYFYIHHINILHKYGWNHSLDNNVMNLYLTVCRSVRSTSKFLL